MIPAFAFQALFGGTALTNPMTTAGDMIVGGSGGTPTRIAKDVDGKVWTMVSGAPAWATPSAGAGGAMTKIAQVVCAGSQSVVTFSSIPGTFTDLVIKSKSRQTGSSSPQLVYIKFNSDSTAANYTAHRLYSDAPGTTSAGTDVPSTTSGGGSFYTAGTSAATHPIAIGNIEISGYADTALEHAWLANNAVTFNTSNGVSSGQIAGGWQSTAAITRIDLTILADSFKNGSIFTLYGLG